GDEFAVVAARAVVRGEFAAEIEDAALVADVGDRPVHADVVARDVNEAGLRVVGHRLPVLAADQVRADALGGVIGHARALVWVLDGSAGGDVPFLGPGGRNIFLRRQDLARLAVDDKEEAVAV